MYVGITRAKERLYLFHSMHRYSYGYMEPLEESRYYRDIPPELRAENGSASYFQPTTRAHQSLKTWKDLKREAKRPAAKQIQFHPGDKVIHPKWGSGLVLNSTLQDDDEIIDIFFENVGKKKLIASLANLKKTG